MILETNNLSKHYGKFKALDELNLEIKRGTVFGLLGPNGSGKTTTLGIILGCLNKTSGSFSWFGGENGAATRQKLGALLEGPLFYPYMSAIDNLKLACKIKNCTEDNLESVLKLVGLWERRNSAFKTFSLGMKQRLSIASALIADPEVLVLDEPTNGLDPQGIAEIRELIIEIANKGKTIILASHMLDEVQKVCTDFAILSQGKMLHQGKVDEDLGDEENIHLASFDPVALEAFLEGNTDIKKAKKIKGLWEVYLVPSCSQENFAKSLAQNNILLSHFQVQKKSLEAQFLEILNNQHA
jgi:ABC-2 type transport system ATP-binding protein